MTFTRSQWRKAKAILESRTLDPCSEDSLNAEIAEALGIKPEPAPYQRPPKKGTFARALYDQQQRLIKQSFESALARLEHNHKVFAAMRKGGTITFQAPEESRKEVNHMAKTKKTAPAMPKNSAKKKGKGGKSC